MWNSGEPEGTPGKSKEFYGTLRNSKELQGNPGKSRKLQGTPGNFRELKGNSWELEGTQLDLFPKHDRTASMKLTNFLHATNRLRLL